MNRKCFGTEGEHLWYSKPRGRGCGVGTEGIGFDVAVPLTKYVQARVGLNVIPKINIDTSVDVTGPQ